MVIVAVGSVPTGSKPRAAVSVRISTGERYGLPLSTRASSLQGRARGSAFMLKPIKLVGPAWTLFAEQLSPCFA